MARRRIQGVSRVRKLMRRMPDAARDELVQELNVTGAEIARLVRAKAPSRRGDLRDGLSHKVFPKTLRLQVGLLGSKAERTGLFYGRIQDLGRKAQIVRVIRHLGRGKVGRYLMKGGARVVDRKPYDMRVRAMAPKRFVTGRYPELRRQLVRNVRGIFVRALSTMTGVGDE